MAQFHPVLHIHTWRLPRATTEIWCWASWATLVKQQGASFQGQLGVNCWQKAAHHLVALQSVIEFKPMPLPAMSSLYNQWMCKVSRVDPLLTERRVYIMTISPRSPSAVQACCLFPVRSLISPLLRLSCQPLLASVRSMSWSYTWALGSWYTLKAMSHSRWKCFTLEQGHTKIMADSVA